MNKGHQLGKIAELYAQQFFVRKGYQLLAKNYRYRKAEVDLIVRKNNTVVCVEVKARSYDYYGHPSAFISVKKQQLLCITMDQFAQTILEAVEFRFEILCIYKSNNQWQVDHLKNAFYCMHLLLYL